MIAKIDRFFAKHLPLWGIFLILFLLRVPNFTEPYWYGDEGIYLTLGVAMRHGARLYAEIIDHKTPIIYYLAMVPNQFWFRVLNLFAMMGTTAAFYFFSLKLGISRKATIIATSIFMLLTTLPRFEGNIPNGELFVMAFVFFGLMFLTKTQLFAEFFAQTKAEHAQKHQHETLFLFATGFFLGLSILTKVPALFDAAAVMSIGWFLSVKSIVQGPKNPTKSLLEVAQFMRKTVMIGMGVLLPIVISIIYFILRGSGKAYLDYGLLYNFRYAGSWQPQFSAKIFEFIFSLKGKALILVSLFFTTSLLTRFLSARAKFLITWFSFALFAAILSNRPYPHYYLQVFPPLALLIGHLITVLSHSKKIHKLELAMSSLVIVLFVGTLKLLQVGYYPTISYYQRFFKTTTGQITWEQYRNSFDSLLADNYRAANILRASSNPQMFIWGTNPMLYAMVQKYPTGRFTVLFHIRDFQAEQESYQSVLKVKPDYVVVMKNEQILPELEQYLIQSYMPNPSFAHFTLWKKR